MDRNVYEACSNIIKEFGTHTVSADEVLAEKIDNVVPIPFKTREDLNTDAEKDRNEGVFEGNIVPDIDLRVVHYYATQLCLSKYPHLINAFDETSLVTLGLLIEKWVKDYLICTNTEDTSQNKTIGKGPCEFISKHIDYRHAPGNI
ncbi:Rrn10p [Saccharomyces eubayanus]|uniref:Rrn10p n=1 Tax=Saccharomyces eubayanus TaxID=1080349 RepID=UPI0006BF1137|nr:RRN10-like protein [Saccharomyces eubayanus]KOH00821.1 RRN10-like protein [Saccharomyces eubayanus]